MLGVAALLLDVDALAAPQRNRSMKLPKPSKGPRGRMRKLWLKVDPALLNSSDSLLISPRLSISPWTYESSYDVDRVPYHIFEAKCERTGCLTRDGQEDMGLESKPIFYQILVLRRVKAKRQESVLQLEKKTVKVGCTCAVCPASVTRQAVLFTNQ
uniref:Interleukin 17a/f3 n=1 Tax=Electrophorus electricus TaxID=8005 RepID=A0A4W4EI95_ELEEL